MAETEFNGFTYRLAKLDAMTEFHVMRRIAPLTGAAMSGGEMTSVLDALSRMPDADVEYVIGKTLADCRRVTGDTAAKVYVNGQLMFDDIGMVGMLKLAIETLKEPLSGFFTGLSSLSLRPGS